MKLEIFYQKIVTAVKEDGMKDAVTSSSSQALLAFLDDIIKSDTDDFLKMTRLTIVFEAFSKCIQDGTTLKDRLIELKQARWSNHYGTPTITFMLTYGNEIERIRNSFIKGQVSNTTIKEWTQPHSVNLTADKDNFVMVDVSSTDTVTMPLEDERTGQFLKTHNPSGGFTTTPCDPVSQKFIEYASQIAAGGGTVLEIGAAFGAASLQALAKGARVFCNDIEPSNLAVVRNRYLKSSGNSSVSSTGDSSKLILVPGSFPEELAGLPEKFFDAILICRVLHFFTGDKIEESLSQMAKHLKPGGKLFVVCETPFLKNWERFIPDFDKRVAAGVKWPGEITTPADYESSGRAASLPKFVHWITKEILERSLLNTKLEVEHLSYIDRCGQFPNDLLLDGRESIGAVAAKPNSM